VVALCHWHPQHLSGQRIYPWAYLYWARRAGGIHCSRRPNSPAL